MIAKAGMSMLLFVMQENSVVMHSRVMPFDVIFCSNIKFFHYDKIIANL